MLDTVLMFFVSVVFNVNHPHTIIAPTHKDMVRLGSSSREGSQGTV